MPNDELSQVFSAALPFAVRALREYVECLYENSRAFSSLRHLVSGLWSMAFTNADVESLSMGEVDRDVFLIPVLH